MISVRGLSKRYGDFLAVDSISFEVSSREVVGFLGPNGAGKSSTLRMLAGFLAPTAGSARLGGADVVESGLEVRRRIGYLPENNPLYEEMDVGEYLEFSGEVRGMSREALRKGVRGAVDACQLGDVLGKPIGLLSKGFRQRVGLASSILHDPDILLLDEPTSGLDPNQTVEVRGLIQRLREEKTVLLSTHILSEVEASCDRVIILNAGRIAAEGSPAELAARGGRRVRVAFREAGTDDGDLREGLGAIEGVESVALEVKNGERRAVLTAGENADPREAVFRLSAERGWPLLELRAEEASLEAVFRELTPR
jgi:ABC-2 type transport system ATP-binding protein